MSLNSDDSAVAKKVFQTLALADSRDRSRNSGTSHSNDSQINSARIASSIKNLLPNLDYCEEEEKPYGEAIFKQIKMISQGRQRARQLNKVYSNKKPPVLPPTGGFASPSKKSRQTGVRAASSE